jgi:uncharacterized protein YecT (DUF1311 family)
MRRLIPALAVAALLSIRAAGAAPADDPFKDTDCKKAQTQMELNYCADRDYQAEDKKLNALYRTIMSKYDAKSQALLKAAEKNWITYRDSECNFETASSEGGSTQPMEDSICLNNKTHARIKELQAQRDCAEGDLTCNAAN